MCLTTCPRGWSPIPSLGSDILGYINIIGPQHLEPSAQSDEPYQDPAWPQAGTQLWRQSQDPGPALRSPAPCRQRPCRRTASQGDAQPQPPVPKPRTVPGWQTARPGRWWCWLGPLEFQRRNHPTNGMDHVAAQDAGPGHAVLQRQLPVTPDDPDGGGRWSPTGWMGRRRKTTMTT